jgi:hypothetical protein
MIISVITVIVSGRWLITLDILDLLHWSVVRGKILVSMNRGGMVNRSRSVHRLNNGAGDQGLLLHNNRFENLLDWNIGWFVDIGWFVHGGSSNDRGGGGHDLLMVVVVVEFWGWVNSRTALADDGVETVDAVGCVVDGADGTVRFDEAVLTFDHIAVAHFALTLLVACVRVVDAVVELVFWV